MDNKYHNSIDLCFECREETPVVQRSGFRHISSHLVVKTTRRIHDGEGSRIIRKAKVVAERIKERYRATQAPPSRIEGPPQPDGHVAMSKSEVQVPRCWSCETPVLHPFWACVECGTWCTFPWHQFISHCV